MQISDLKIGGDFSATGIKTAVPAGTAGIPGSITLVSRVIPSGAPVFLKNWSAKVIDVANADQIYFAILRNGTPIQSGLERIPALQFDFQPQIDLSLYLSPGLIEIKAYNISGMLTSIEPEAIAAVIVNAQAWWAGVLLSEKGGIS